MTVPQRTLGILGFWLLCAVSPAAFAQSGSFIQVYVGPPVNTNGPTFFVDNVPYTSRQVFRWQVGDTHTVRLNATQAANPFDPINTPSTGGPVNDAGLGVKYAFTGGTVDVPTDAIAQPPLGAVQAFTQVSGAQTEFIWKIQVWSFLKGLSLNFGKLYRLRFVTPSVGCAPTATGTIPGACDDVPGYTLVQSLGGACENLNPDGSLLATTGDYWCPEGDIEMHSIPDIGYAFKDWNSNPGLINNGALGVPGSIRFRLASTFTIQINFGPGKFYRLVSDPAGLEVAVDRAVIRTAPPSGALGDVCASFGTVVDSNGVAHRIFQGGDTCVNFLFGSTRLLGAPELQLDSKGKQQIFDSWSFGGGQNALFEVSGANLSTDTITAKFLPAAPVTFLTAPVTRLPLIVSSRTWPHDNFWFGQGKDVAFSAPNESLDSNGRRWRFKGWSNGGPAAQTLKITQDIVDKGLYLVANYEPMNKVSVETNPPGLSVVIDGKTCQTPCVIEKLTTEMASISPVKSVTQADVLRLEFTSWSDGGPADRQIDFQPEVRRLVANYKALYRFSALSNPQGNASFTFAPASDDGFYNVDTRVTVTAKAANGFRFRRWTGDTAGQFPSATITVGGPRGVVAELEAVPFLDPAGIRNSAGTGPQDQGPTGRVAPGSLITIYGTNLTPKEELGARSPWTQSLAEVVARVGDRFLPLAYASGNQINAQLPYDLTPGKYTLTLIRTGQADVSGDFEIVRNAPGLFGQYGTDTADQLQLVYAFRADGSVISDAAPAKPNEIISLIGTGVGPYRNNPPAGFAIPGEAEFTLADTVEVLAGDQVIAPVKVIATPGFVGMTSIQIRIGAQFPVGESTNIRLRVNGKESNTVRLLVR